MEMNFEVSTYALRALCTKINVLCMYYKLIFYEVIHGISYTGGGVKELLLQFMT
jgi:hypothetical protein